MKPVHTINNKITGVTMIEVMVSLVILTMGLLGMAALQGVGTNFGNKAYYRSQATMQAYDLIDRMRANPTAVAAGDYVQDPMPTSYTIDCGSIACTIPSDLAEYDLVAWNAVNANLLPGGTGAATSSSGLFTVQVSWQEDTNDDGVAETKTVTTSAEL